MVKLKKKNSIIQKVLKISIKKIEIKNKIQHNSYI